jgi:2-C-methyl-D-erythritol 4-phosphate cytidylyltransferase
MNLETKITIYKFTPQLFTLTQLNRELNQEWKQQLM